jgi:hypothetical protein
VIRLGLALLVLLSAFCTVAQEADFVVVDRGKAAYWVVARFPAASREAVQSKLKPGDPVELVDWAAFKADPARHAGAVIVKDEYPDARLLAGIVKLLEKYPQIPFGIAWTGGLALTRNDYRHTERIHAVFRERPEDYETSKVSGDPRRDPIHPSNHLGPLLSR